MTGVSQEKRVSGGSGFAAAARHPSRHVSRSHFDRREKSIPYKLIISHPLIDEIEKTGKIIYEKAS